MSQKFTCFSKVGVVFSLLLIATVQSLPLEELEKEILRDIDDTTPLPETTTQEPGSGWGSSEPSGDTASFGQTMIVEGLAASNIESNPSVLEAIAPDDETLEMSVLNSQVADLQFQSNSWAPGGGLAVANSSSASADAAYNALNQGATYGSLITLTGVSSGGIISNPQTSAGLSAGTIVISSTGQATDGTNVSPQANNGWGWTAQGNGWGSGSSSGQREQSDTEPDSSGWSTEGSGWGWSATQEGATAAATSLESIGHLSQQANATDNITAIAYGNGEDSLNLNAEIVAPIAVETSVDGNGVNATAGNTTAGTQWQNLDAYSYPENNLTLSINNADAIAVSAQPTSSTTISFGNITVSDFATAASGNNLVNQNNNGGWGKPSQGWGKPTQGWGMSAPANS